MFIVGAFAFFGGVLFGLILADAAGNDDWGDDE